MFITFYKFYATVGHHNIIVKRQVLMVPQMRSTIQQLKPLTSHTI